MGQTFRSKSDARHAVLAGFLGWTLDAFDFFVVTLMYDVLAKQFGVSKSDIILTTFATLAMRPIGALIFGVLSDRYGRRLPLMANVIYFSVVEVMCGFSPNYKFFFVMRALYGIGMGGEWGVGASLAMEAAPARWRGVLSGILQSGYPIGNMLAALAARFILPTGNWRAMFWIGALPALLALYIRAKVPESEAWKQNRVASTGQVLRIVGREWKKVCYLVVLMTFMMFLSHGTQDLYPDFLQEVHRASAAVRANIAIIYNIGAVVGAIIFGQLSQVAGRRKGMAAALGLSLAMIPLWAFGGSLTILMCAAFLMQAGVQGAWGVIPVHLNEMSADATRGLMPGLTYQLGILFASPTNTIEYALRDRVGYQWAIAGFEIVTILALAVLLLFGTERHGRSFLREPNVGSPPGPN
ncbi:MAG TPA: MFS transporter [Candidatus Solibacter sp.]|nr:MFS transporter [Candidatus Solibacter sp.]